MRNAKDGERKGHWGEKPIKHLYVLMAGVEEGKLSKERVLTGCSWTESCGGGMKWAVVLCWHILCTKQQMTGVRIPKTFSL